MTGIATTSSRAEPGASYLPGDKDVWVFIIAELSMFGVFFVAYIVNRAAEPALFNASQQMLDICSGALNTLILLTSSWMVSLAVTAARRNASRATSRLLVAALALAGAFVVVKFFEYSSKFASGIDISSNNFFMFYFSITFIHLIHVMGGSVILLVMSVNAGNGRYTAANMRGLEAGASYWHMVDLVWIVLFPLIYLLR
ncbi:cytochrome c oxidase subunit 3 family protein [Oleomonas cavernae]|uniref:Cytochrome c oxidase subunit 3 family protein n=1 Tax=Oleomonas cavernae TaxID=2320859 RepID=A0A418WHH8_9PROT|nr:cytochrome c oxidase subunit 3 family protein [Oleomonas cavernae]RJF89412.1 cytochrome c oxidase subunit 3 family protein [Oleomonas cavernae]